MYNILNDIRVLDLCRYISGPSCCRILGDMGAEVIKVEKAGRGDDTRVMGPYYNGTSLYFPSYNRNKKSVTVDFRSDNGKELLRRLIAKSDVIVENFKAGTMAAMGLSFEEIHKINPRAILVSITGFGQTGPDAKRPAYDAIVSYRGRMYEDLGNGHFSLGGGMLSDVMAGINAALSVMLALYSRQQTGLGQHIDLCMLTSSVSSMPMDMANYFFNGPSANMLIDSPNGFFLTKDDKWMMLIAGPQSMFLRLREIVDDPVIKDEKYLTIPARIQENELLLEHVHAWVRTKTSEEMDQLMSEAGITCVKVSGWDDVLQDKQLLHRNDLLQMEIDGIGKVPYVRFPAKFSGLEYVEDTPPPQLGADNTAILTGLLGMSPDEVARYTT